MRSTLALLLLVACGSPVFIEPPAPPREHPPSSPPQTMQASTCALQRSPQAVVSDLQTPKLIALDDENIYWSAASKSVTSTEALWKISKEGTTAPVRLADGLQPVSALAAWAGNLYWIDAASQKLVTLAKGASTPTELVAAGVSAMVVDARGVFFIDSDEGAVKRAGLDGAGLTTLATGQLGAAHLKVDESSAYWMNVEGQKLAAYTVMKVALEGGEPVTLMGELTFGAGIAIDATDVFISTGDRLLKVSKSGEGLQVLLSMQSIVGPLAADAKRVFWANAETTAWAASLQSLDLATSQVATVTQIPQQVVALTADASGVYWVAGGQTAADGVLNRACE